MKHLCALLGVLSLALTPAPFVLASGGLDARTFGQSATMGMIAIITLGYCLLSSRRDARVRSERGLADTIFGPDRYLPPTSDAGLAYAVQADRIVAIPPYRQPGGLRSLARR